MPYSIQKDARKAHEPSGAGHAKAMLSRTASATEVEIVIEFDQ